MGFVVFLCDPCGKKTQHSIFQNPQFWYCPPPQYWGYSLKFRVMKQLLMIISGVCIFSVSHSQNVGIGTTTPTTKLHVVGTLSNIATFSGGDNMYITLGEGINNRGYIGSFAGNPEDVDFGTYGGNATGKLHLTIQDAPKLTVASSGNIGIGTTTPLSLLHATNGAVLFDGTTGATPVSGAGVRMMWIPAKKAFRTGEVTGTQWDDAQIGPWTFAGGLNNTALGYGTTVFGLNNSAYGDYSFNAGTAAVTDGNSSVAFGVGTRAKYWSGMVVGNYNDSTAGSQTCCNDPLNRVFQIGNGTNNSARSNAMTVLENGKVGIGTTTPAQLLDVNGAIEIGNTATNSAGAIRFNGINFEGNNGTNWKSFDLLPAGTIVVSTIYPNTALESSGYKFLGNLFSSSQTMPVNGVAADTWLPISDSLGIYQGNRTHHSSVWTGTKMIAWGGTNALNPLGLNSGAIYDPVTNVWAGTSLINAPTIRYDHSAVWTNSEMIIWGGSGSLGVNNTGGKYSPLSDTWTTTSTVNAPSARTKQSAVWSGTEMIVWGGNDGASDVNTGSRYNPVTNTWTTMSTVNAPSSREAHSAVWSNSEMLVWGGGNFISITTYTLTNTGARYNPTTNTWTTMSTVNAPTARYAQTQIWTGTEMIVWGGYDGTSTLNTGARYNPVTNTWTTMSTVNAPTPRWFHTAIWTGTEMIVWGGGNFDGSRYNPVTNTWTVISSVNHPQLRFDHTAVWTGKEMIIYGGSIDGSYSSALQTGGRYYPVAQPAYNTALEITGQAIYLYSKQ